MLAKANLECVKGSISRSLTDLPFIKKTRKKYRETGDSRYIYQNELDKSCFQRDMKILKIRLED